MGVLTENERLQVSRLLRKKDTARLKKSERIVKVTRIVIIYFESKGHYEDIISEIIEIDDRICKEQNDINKTIFIIISFIVILVVYLGYTL